MHPLVVQLFLSIEINCSALQLKHRSSIRRHIVSIDPFPFLSRQKAHNIGNLLFFRISTYRVSRVNLVGREELEMGHGTWDVRHDSSGLNRVVYSGPRGTSAFHVNCSITFSNQGQTITTAPTKVLRNGMTYLRLANSISHTCSVFQATQNIGM